jgi:hypothetical protein
MNSILTNLQQRFLQIGGVDLIANARNCLEATLVHLECQNPKLAQHIHSIHTIFSTVNLGWFFWRLHHELLNLVNWLLERSLAPLGTVSRAIR